MKKYVDFVEKNAKKLIVFIVVLNLVAFLGLFRIRINTSYETFMPKTSEQKELLDKYSKEFKSEDTMMVAVEYDGDLYSIEGLNFTVDIENKLEKIEGVEDVIGPVPKAVPVGFLKMKKNV